MLYRNYWYYLLLSLSPNFKINALSIALVVICLATTEKPAGNLCPKCIFVTLLHYVDLVLLYFKYL